MRLMLALILVLFPTFAMAGDLRVTINMAIGQDPVRFMLSSEQTRTFWGKWNRLPKTDDMVAIPGGSDYGGLTLYDDERDTEVRLFSGVGKSGDDFRADQFRQLERWVLGFAPPPLGPSLMATLDSDVDQQPGGTTARSGEPLDGQQIINACNRRARGNARLKMFCINDQLAQQADPTRYANALSALALQLLPPKADGVPRQPDAGRDGLQ